MGEPGFSELLQSAKGDGEQARRSWGELLRRSEPLIRAALTHEPSPPGGIALSAIDADGLIESLFERRRELDFPGEDDFVAHVVGRIARQRQEFSPSAVTDVGPPGSSAEGDSVCDEAQSETGMDAVPPPPSPSSDPQRIDRFEIRDVLGTGGFGTVYRAWDPQLQRLVALKVPRPEVLATGDLRERFLREARAAAALQHPQICPVHDVRTSATGCFIVMSLLDGSPLSDVIRERSPLPQEEAVAIVRSTARALCAAHEQGIVHRDLKPANIMLDRRGVPIVMDFGLAVRTGADDPRLTQSGALVGTPAYMSPEQMRGSSDVGPQTDVYSLGAVLYELLTGRRPHTGRTVADLIAAALSTDPPPPSTLAPGIAPRIDALCAQALAREPANRYVSMEAFAAALEAIASPAAEPPRCSTGVEDRLPLPLARLYRRSGSAKTALERRQLAFYLWEAGLKLLGAVAVIEYARIGRQDADVERCLQHLARPSIGHWWQIVRQLVPRLAEQDAAFAPIRDLLTGNKRDDLPAVAGMFNALGEALQQRGTSTRVQIGELFDRLVEYRNKEIGHGVVGARSQEHYDRMARSLRTGLTELFGRLDVLAGRQLVYVSEVRQTAAGGWQVDCFELLGLEPQPRPPLQIPAEQTAALPRTQKLYLHPPADHGSPATELTPERVLHPLIIYDALADDVLFLNGRAGRKHAEYLSYTTGDTQRQVLADEQRELLARILGREVEQREIEAWADRSLAEERDEQGVAESRPEPKCIGDFELISVIGEGGMGRVYRAWQPSLGRQVALKRLNHSTDDKARARFTREIRALGRIDHPGLVKVYTSGADADEYFFAMELIEGTDLGRVCRRLEQSSTASEIDRTKWQSAVSSACEQARSAERRIRPDDGGDDIPVPRERFHHAAVPGRTNQPYVAAVTDIVRQIAEAADVLHQAGIVHRDIKPANIMVTPSGDAVLTDLGLAQLADSADGQLTRTRQFVGTLRYASPEQVLAVGRVDRRSDVYSLGATLWELLTLRPLFAATDETPSPELMRLIQQKEPDSIRRFNPAVPQDLDAIVLKCLDKDPDRRYQTAAELADDLRRWQAGDPIRARRRTTAYLIAKSAARHRRALGVAAGVACLILLAAAVGWLGYVRPSDTLYSNWTSIHRVPVGIGELSPDSAAHREFSARLTTRGWWGPVIEIATVNGSGRPIQRIPPIIGDRFDRSLQVARIRIEYDEHSRMAREIGLDEQGHIQWQAAYHYDPGGRTVASFLDSQGYLHPLGDSMATYVTLRFNERGFVEEVYYTGAGGEPQPNADGSYGTRYVWDDSGLCLSETSVDFSGRPIRNNEHVVQVLYEHSSSLQIESVRFRDSEGSPVLHAGGYCGWKNEFDQYGNVVRTIYLDANDAPTRTNVGIAGFTAEYDDRGNLVMAANIDLDGVSLIESADGYAGWRSEFDSQGRETRRLHFDAARNPAITADGTAGWESAFDEQGNEIERRFLDPDGRPTRHNDGNASWIARYDDQGRQIEWLTYDLDGSLFPRGEGVAGHRAERDQRGNITLLEYVGPDGAAVLHADGEAAWSAEYNSRGHRTRETYLGLDGRPRLVRNGYAGWRAKLNSLGQQEEFSYRGVEDELVLDGDGIAGWRAQFDARGNEIERTFFGLDGRPKLHKEGYAGWRKAYDDRGNRIEEEYFGLDGELVVAAGEGVAWIKSEFDDRDREIRRMYYGANRKPALHHDGNFGLSMEYDERGRRTLFAYLDRDGNLLRLTEGFAGYRSEYDERGLEIRRTYIDEQRRPSPHVDGNHGWEVEFDERGNRVRYALIDEQGGLFVGPEEGVAGWRASYDQWNRRIEQTFFGDDGQPKPHAEGHTQLTHRYDARGYQVEWAYRDAAGNLQERSEGVAGWRNEFDERGNWLTMAYFDASGRPAENIFGVALWGAEYDERGNEVRNYYQNIKGELIASTGTNAAGWTSEYDGYNREVKRMYFGVDGQPVMTTDGYAGAESVYDEYGSTIRYTFVDAASQPVIEPTHGYAGWQSQFDALRRETDRTYFDADGATLPTALVIEYVMPGLAADEAGIETGDIVLSYAGVEGTGPRLTYERIRLLELEAPPESVPVRVRRNGEELTFDLKVGWLGVHWSDYVIPAADAPATPETVLN